MKIKKLISAFCLAAGLTLAVPALSSTLGVPDVISTVSAAEGWNQDENGWYYLQGDTKLLGLQTIGSDKYYFDENGKIINVGGVAGSISSPQVMENVHANTNVTLLADVEFWSYSLFVSYPTVEISIDPLIYRVGGIAGYA